MGCRLHYHLTSTGVTEGKSVQLHSKCHGLLHKQYVLCKYLLQVIQDRYSSLNAIPGPDFEVCFKDDTISLAVPEDGICLPNGWIIIPLVPPVVSLWTMLKLLAFIIYITQFKLD